MSLQNPQCQSDERKFILEGAVAMSESLELTQLASIKIDRIMLDKCHVTPSTVAFYLVN